MTQSEVLVRAQELLQYQFNDADRLHTALTHASVADSRVESNERLEFLGDSILGLVVCEELFHRFPDYLEGEMTKLKSVVVSRKVCAQIADKIGLTPLIFLGKGMAGRDSIPTSLRAAVLESVIAGIFLDGGFDAAKEFILRHVGEYIQQADRSEHQDNHKSLLQQYAQRVLSATPHYEQLDEQGPDHSKCFEVCVTIGQRRFAAAWGASKKEAEQLAAQLAMEELTNDDRSANGDQGVSQPPPSASSDGRKSP